METSYTASSASPAVQLPTNRSLLKFVLLSIITSPWAFTAWWS